jgi:hypothetical protein
VDDAADFGLFHFDPGFDLKLIRDERRPLGVVQPDPYESTGIALKFLCSPLPRYVCISYCLGELGIRWSGGLGMNPFAIIHVSRLSEFCLGREIM